MSRTIAPDDWPLFLDEDELVDVVGLPTFERGALYAAQGRVLSLSVAAQGALISARVQGSGSRQYTVMLHADPQDPSAWSGRCSCPVGEDCKHCVAVILAAQTQVLTGQSTGSALPAVSWDTQLAGVMSHPGTGGRRIALQVEEAGAPWGRLSLCLRPLLEGQRGWVRTGITWQKIMDGSLAQEVDYAVLASLQDLASLALSIYSYSSATINLNQVSGLVWPLLEAAQDAGVTLTTDQHHGRPVRLSRGVEVGTSVEVLEDGSALISPMVSFAGVPELASRWRQDPEAVGEDLHLLGQPVHGFAVWQPDGSLILAPVEGLLPPGLSRFLTSPRQAITVPAADVPRLESEFLPLMLRQMDVALDPRLRPSTPAPPTLVARVEVDPDLHTARTRWLLSYAAGDGRTLHEVPLTALSSQDAGLLRSPHPVRDHPAELRAVQAAAAAIGEHPDARLLEQSTAGLAGGSAARFLSEVLPRLERDLAEVLMLEVVGDGSAYHEVRGELVISADVSDDPQDRDWFSLRVRVRVGDAEVPMDRLMDAVAHHRSEVLLDDGGWVDLAGREEVTALAEIMQAGADLAEPGASGGELRLTALQAGYYDQLVALGVVERATARWRRNVERMARLRLLADSVAADRPQDGQAEPAGQAGLPQTGREDDDASRPDPLAPVPLPQGLQARLRPYQEEGYQWLDLLRRNELGGVLADDMGLGKTLQVLATVCRLVEDPASQDGPVLVVAPTSVVPSWIEQAARFAPGLTVVAVRQTGSKRGTALSQEIDGADVVVTSYALLRLDEEEMTAQPWSWVVLDEAQFIKNRQSATYKAARRLRTPATLAITGTPLENSLMDLWSLMSVTAPGLLPAPDRFAEIYRRPIERGEDPGGVRLTSLRRRIAPFMLRRTKEEVAGDLPTKTEQVMSVELTPAHRRAYDARLSRERQRVLGLLEQDTAQSRFTALRSLTLLRQLALDPSLTEAGSSPAATRRPSAKTQALLDALAPVVAEGHKALVFSQFTRYLTLVRDHLERAGTRTAYLDGSTPDRAAVIESFRRGEADVFLISLKAGGFGLTLTEADYVFLLDPWWNPQAEEQAVDRAHRIGQDKPVLVYRLVSAGTIEEKVMALKERKADLFARVVEGTEDAADEEPGALSGDGAQVASSQQPGGAPAGGRRRAVPDSARKTGLRHLTAQDIRELLEP